MRFVRAGVAIVAVAFLVGVAFSVFHRSPASNVPVAVGVGQQGKLAVSAVMSATNVTPPMMVGTKGDSAYSLAFSRRGQSLGAELVRSQIVFEGGINQTVTTYTAALVDGRLVLRPQGQRAGALRGHGRGDALVITDPNHRGGEIVLHPGSSQDLSNLEARIGDLQAKLAAQI